MFSRRSLLATAAALLLSTPALANDDPFPRLAGVNNGSPHNYEDAAYQRKLAKLDLSILAIWVGWENSRGMTMEQVVRNIHAINPRSRVFLYENGMEVADGNSAARTVYDKVDSMNWWTFPRGDDGQKLLSPFGQNTGKENYLINNTLFTPRDRDGYQFWDWHARWVIRQYYKPNPSIAGFFEDNVYWRPRVDVDWNRDGVTDLRTSPEAGKWLREAYRKRFALMHQLMPGKTIIGNVADWGDKKSVLTEYNGMLDGGLMEGILGTRHSPEAWSSWQDMMRWYRKTMAAFSPSGPRLLIFHQRGDPQGYQALRYGLASCLLDDAYFAFSKEGAGYNDVAWFDEYDAQLGQPLEGPALQPWKNGVYRRNFEKGIALVNPRGNGPVEVELETDFKRIAGKQAPTVNNGQLTRKVKLNDRDGIILLRTKAQALPSAPKLVGVR
jgi:hypothetical protein